jgi:hypothetical protein
MNQETGTYGSIKNNQIFDSKINQNQENGQTGIQGEKCDHIRV